MKKVSKAILIGLAILAALGIAVVVGLNLYIQSPGSRARIQEELSKSLRLPLKLENVSVSPFGQLHITGITIPNGGANFLDVASFQAQYRLLPLLEGKLEITEMSVENPKIVWAQTAEGKWKLPEPEQAKAVSAEDANQKLAKETAKGDATAAQSQEKKPKEEVQKVAAEKKSKFAVLVDRFDVKGGEVELFDGQNKHLAVFSDVNMTYTALAADHVEGTATIGKIVYADGLTLENVTTPFKFEGGAFNLPEIEATLAEGTVQAKYHTHNEGEHSPFKVAVTFTKLDLNRLGMQLGADPGQMTGSLNGQIEIHGDRQFSDRREGEGRVDIRDAQFHQLDLFESIGQLLGLKELRVRDGHVDLRLSGEKVHVDSLTLNTADLQLTAHGMARLDKRLNLDAQISVEDAVAQRLPSVIRDSFQPIDGGRRAIQFVISGTTDKPKTNLVNKLIGQKIDNQFGDVLSSIFGGEKKQPDDKKEEKKKKKDKDKDKDKGATGTPAPGTRPPDLAPESASSAPAPATPQPSPATPQPQPAAPNP